MDKITKLSQAIRLGATFRPQCTRFLYRDGASCALGAAAEAIGWKPSSYETPAHKMLDKRFPELDALVELPILPKGMKSPLHISELRDNIMYLNDACSWTREQIADWLETQGL